MKRLFPVILSLLFGFSFIYGGVLMAADKYPVKPIECIVAIEAGGWGCDYPSRHAKGFADVGSAHHGCK